eukprot:3933161-Rhodomonas_salina.4
MQLPPHAGSSNVSAESASVSTAFANSSSSDRPPPARETAPPSPSGAELKRSALHPRDPSVIRTLFKGHFARYRAHLHVIKVSIGRCIGGFVLEYESQLCQYRRSRSRGTADPSCTTAKSNTRPDFPGTQCTEKAIDFAAQ